MHNFYNLNPNHEAHLTKESANIILDINAPLENKEFDRLFEAYCIAPSETAQNDLGMHLNEMNYLLGLITDEETSSQTKPSQISIQKGDDLRLLICSNRSREVFLPLFTNDKELKDWYNEPVNTLTVPAKWLWNFVLNQKNYAGILINPNSIAWSINMEQIQSLLNDIG